MRKSSAMLSSIVTTWERTAFRTILFMKMRAQCSRPTICTQSKGNPLDRTLTGLLAMFKFQRIRRTPQVCLEANLVERTQGWRWNNLFVPQVAKAFQPWRRSGDLVTSRHIGSGDRRSGIHDSLSGFWLFRHTEPTCPTFRSGLAWSRSKPKIGSPQRWTAQIRLRPQANPQR